MSDLEPERRTTTTITLNGRQILSPTTRFFITIAAVVFSLCFVVVAFLGMLLWLIAVVVSAPVIVLVDLGLRKTGRRGFFVMRNGRGAVDVSRAGFGKVER